MLLRANLSSVLESRITFHELIGWSFTAGPKNSVSSIGIEALLNGCGGQFLLFSKAYIKQLCVYDESYLSSKKKLNLAASFLPKRGSH